MSPLVPRLAEHGEVVLVDLPDCGRAPDDPSLDPDDSARDVRAIVEGLAPARVTLVGLSYGAYLAARLASVGPPANLDRLVCIAGFARMTEEHRARFEALAGEVEAGRLSRAELAGIALSLWFPSGPTEADAARVQALVESLPLDRMARAIARVGACAREDREVGRYELEAVLVHGRGDAAVPLALGEELASRGARATLRVLETDVHLLTWSHVPECVDAILGR